MHRLWLLLGSSLRLCPASMHCVCVCVCVCLLMGCRGQRGRGELWGWGRASWVHAETQTRNDLVWGVFCFVRMDKYAIILLSVLN